MELTPLLDSVLENAPRGFLGCRWKEIRLWLDLRIVRHADGPQAGASGANRKVSARGTDEEDGVLGDD